MGHRRLVMLVGSMVATFASQMACALGLGEITLNSSLNQPLSAEIKLLQVRDLTEQEILVGLATNEDFTRVGVDKPYFLTDLRFDIDLNAPGGPVVRVTSRKPVREPYLNFIVQAQWPSGKLLREYTLLMDLPVFTDQAAAPVSGAQSSTVAQQPRAKKQQQASAPETRSNPRSAFTPEGGQPARPSARPSSVASSAPPALAGTSSYSVQTNDTLWEIASQVRPDRGVSIQQTMLAIQRLNPEAFINNNINLLKSGQVLRIPDRSEIEQYSKQRAVQEVASQNAAWDGDARYTPGDIQLQGSDSYASFQSRDTGVEGRLKLASPDDASDRYEGRGSGSGSSNTEALENELAITLEQLDKSQRENGDLRSRVESLEEQIKTMERLVQVSNEEMRALELAAQKNAEQASSADEAGALSAETPAQVAQSDVPDNMLKPDGDGGVGDPAGDAEGTEIAESTPGGEVAAAETQSAPAAMATPAPSPTKVVMSTPAPEKGIIDILLDNIIWLAAGVVVLLGAIFLVVQRRHAAAVENFDEDFLAQAEYDGVGKQEQDDDFLSSLENEDDVGDEEDSFDTGAQQEDFDDAGAEPETEDVVAEADIYIAYGKYDQAEEMLLKALDREPGNADMRLKLLEVYSNQQDVKRFDPHYAKLRAIATADGLNRAAQLRKSIGGAGEFDPDLYDTSDVEALASSAVDDDMAELAAFGTADGESNNDDDLSFDLDLGDDLTSTAGEDSDGDDSLDMGLDLDDDFVSNLAAASDSSSTSDDELDLDSSLDFDLSSIEDSGSNASDDDDFDLDLDFGSDSKSASTADSDLIEDDIEQDVDTIDFDLGMDGDETAEAESALNDDFDLELSAEDSMDELSEVPDLDLGGLDEVDLADEEDLLLDSAGPNEETLITKAIDAKTLGGKVDLTETRDDSDDLDIDSELDLSALDQELDAMASDLASDDDLAELDLDDFDEVSTASTGSRDSRRMEEPVTDFDDFDDDLELDNVAHAAKVEDMGEETMFDQAIAEVPDTDLDFELPEIDPEASDDDGDLGFLSDSDETATKLDLARAYIDMGDSEGAKDIIDEIIKEGNMQQQQEAKGLLARLNA